MATDIQFRAEGQVGEQTLSFETGQMAGLADAAVVSRYGDTVILATAVVSKEAREGVDFMPLMVDYEERFYATGKISGSRFIKRENRPSEEAILAARLVDRPIRPLFPKHFRRDVQVIITVLSADLENDPDIIGINAASAALLLAGAPFSGPVGAVRVGLDEAGEFTVNPTHPQRQAGKLDLVVAGTKERVMMLEAGASEVDEDIVFKAITFGHQELQKSINLQEQFLAEAKPEAKEVSEIDLTLHENIKQFAGEKLSEFLRVTDKNEREKQIAEFEHEVLANFEGDYKQAELKSALQKVIEKEVRHLILEDGVRPDGRKITEVRPISVEVALLPRTHGSALFTRGQTQALTIATLGSPSMEQMVDTMEQLTTKRYMHHYNFPPYSTGETRPLRGASRREVGHGALAERALAPVLPSQDDFPYTIRLVSEILASNGSSSMAATCGSTMALMDAGIPISRPVSGIAMGLVTDESDETGKYVILTDLQGLEDFAGDMDFKVAGTEQGITAIQMDTKIKGLSLQMVEETLARAKEGRMEIMGKMLAVLPAPRPELSPLAPRITSIKINPEKIGVVIGPGGKMIHKIIEEAGGREVIDIDIEEDGTVLISSVNPEAAAMAQSMIEGLTHEVKPGDIYTGEVVAIQRDRMSGKEIGAIVKITPNQDGMVHISNLANERVETVSSVVKIGDKIQVQVLEVDPERGRISLSRRALLTNK